MIFRQYRIFRTTSKICHSILAYIIFISLKLHAKNNTDKTSLCVTQPAAWKCILLISFRNVLINPINCFMHWILTSQWFLFFPPPWHFSSTTLQLQGLVHNHSAAVVFSTWPCTHQETKLNVTGKTSVVSSTVFWCAF